MVFHDFPGPGNLKKKFHDFPAGVGTLLIGQFRRTGGLKLENRQFVPTPVS